MARVNIKTWIQRRFGLNTVVQIAILVVLGYVVLSSIWPPVDYSDSHYLAKPSVICAGESLSWTTGIRMTLPWWSKNPAAMADFRDLWNETGNHAVPGFYRSQPFMIPHTVEYTRTEVFSMTATLSPAEYIISNSTGGRLTAQDGYTVRFTVKAC